MNTVASRVSAVIVFLAVACATPVHAAGLFADDGLEHTFTVAVIPDTQNYLDYTHQRAEGFPFDASELFIEQMQFIADNVESAGGEISFVTSVGDVWQHQTLAMDPEHYMRGFRAAPDSLIEKFSPPTSKALTVEMHKAHAGFSLIAGKVPFSVVPGNHDYDAVWTDASHPHAEEIDVHDISTLGVAHPGGLSNFRAVFGARTGFFRDREWYVASNDGGADSAQIFTAGGYRFLHIGLQFAPPDSSLDWAAQVIQRFPGLPTIVSTHDYINSKGRRESNPLIDGNRVDPMNNSPQMLWDKFIRQHDQIFLVLCGHQYGQGMRVDENSSGYLVWQVLADYQGRAQAAISAGAESNLWRGIGDGWMRFMRFDMNADLPVIGVTTYSTHYRKTSFDTSEYAGWYREQEQPGMTDAEFHSADDFQIELTDFVERFGRGSLNR